MIALMRRYGDRQAAHLYEVQTTNGTIEIDANTELEAMQIAERLGYQVIGVLLAAA